jgi:hypothetical protein
VRRAIGIAFLLIIAAIARADDARKIVVVADRSASLRWADPHGRAREATAIAAALAAGQGERIELVPTVGEPVEVPADDGVALGTALRAIGEPPLDAGGADPKPALVRAADAAGERGLVVVATTDELDVVGPRGEVEPELLAAARAASDPPDRKAVNEAARARLVAALPKTRLAGRLFGVRAVLPRDARMVPFLDELGARVVDSDPLSTIPTARALAEALGARGVVASEPVRAAKVDVPAKDGWRVALVCDKPIARAPRGRSENATLADGRIIIIDAAGPFTVDVPEESALGWVAVRRALPRVTARAFRVDGGARVIVRAEAGVALAGRVRTKDKEAALALRDGALEGTVPNADDEVRVDVEADGAALDPITVKVERVALALRAEGPAKAGEPVALAADLPADLAALLPARPSLVLAREGVEARVDLAREGAKLRGIFTPPSDGKWALSKADIGPFAVELAPLDVASAATLTLRAVGDVVVDSGKATLEVDAELAPALDGAIELAVDGGATGRATAKLEQGRGHIALAIDAPGLRESAKARLVARATHAKGESRAELPLDLRPAPFPWKHALAVGLLGVAALWVFAVFARRRALDRRFGQRQVRGIGSNGKISYERHLLRDHLHSRTTAVAPEGPEGATAVRFETQRDGSVVAHALEGSQLFAMTPTGVEAVKELAVRHLTPYGVVRGLYNRRYVYLEREPNADELLRRFVPDAPSYDGAPSRDSDVFVLLDEKENMIPPSQRLVPLESARLPEVRPMVPVDSDESVIMVDSSEEKILDSDVLDPGSSEDLTESSGDVSGGEK